MRKTTAIIFAAIGILLITISSGFLIKGCSERSNHWSSKWSRTVTVTDGKTDPAGAQANFGVNEDGEHLLSLSWLPEGKKDIKDIAAGEPGFLTAITLTDPKGNVVYATSAAAVTIDTTLELEKGNYRLDFHYLTDREAYLEFAKKYLCGSEMAEQWAEMIDFSAFTKNGSWNLDYSIGISKTGSFGPLQIGLIIGMLLGARLLVIFVAIITKGSRIESAKYDERQELEQGRGYRLAFYTMLVYTGLVYCFQMMEMIPAHIAMFLYGGGIFLGTAVYCIYCIWHDCYFALNQKTGTVLIVFALIAAFNLVFGIWSIIDGSIMENGQISFRGLNLLCGALFLVVGAALLAKKLCTGKEAVEEEEAEE